MRLGAKSKLAIGAAAALLLVLGAAHTPVFQNYVLTKVQHSLRAGPGIDLEAARLRYNLFTLAVDAREVSLGSATAAGLPPFLKLSSAQARLRWSALLRGKLVADYIRLEGVAAQIVTDERGTGNLPAGGKGETAGDPNAPLGFVVAHLDADRASLLVADRQRDLTISLPEWRLQIEGNAGVGDHLIRWETTQPGRLTLEGRGAGLRTLALEVLLRAGFLELKRLHFEAEGAEVAAAGVLKDFARPIAKGRVTAEVDLARAGSLVGVAEPVGGRLAAEAAIEGALETANVDARVTGRDLKFRGYAGMELEAAARWEGGAQEVRLDSLRFRSPVGSATARGGLSLAPAPGTSWVEANLSNLDLESLSRQQGLPTRIASRATVSARASWPGLEVARAAGEAKIRLEPTRTEPAPAVAPVAGVMSVTAKEGTLGLEVVSLETLGSRWAGEVRLAGFQKLGGQLRAVIDQLGDTVAGAELALGREKGALAPVPLQGRLELAADLNGTLDRPQIAATLHGSALQAGLIQDAALEASAAYSSEEVRLKDLALTWQGQKLKASGALGLQEKAPFVRANVTISEAALDAILSGLGQTQPVQGLLDLEASVGGTLQDLQAGLSLSARGLKAYGEQWGNLAVKAGLSGQKAVLETLRLDQPLEGGSSGYLRATGTYDLSARTYQVQCEADRLAFRELTLPDDVAIRGSLGLSLEGAGSLEEPSLRGSLNLADVSVGERLLGEFHADARVQKGEATLEARLPRFNTTLNGKVSTNAPHAAEFRIAAAETDLSRLGVSALEGGLNAVITGLGNLGEWKKFQAAVAVDKLHVKLGEQEVRNEGPIEVELRENALEVKSASLRSGNSRLSMMGRLPLERSAAPPSSLGIQGAFDLADLAAFAPPEAGVSAQGQLQLEAAVGGDFTKLDPSVRVALKDGLLAQPELKKPVSGINLQVEYARGAVEIREMAAVLGSSSLGARGTIPVAPLLAGLPLETAPTAGPAQFTLEVRDFDPQIWKGFPEQVAGRIGLRIEAEAAQLADPKTLRAKATFQQLEFQFAELGQYGLTQEGVSAISLGDGSVAIDRLVLAGPKTRLEAAGTMDLMGDRKVNLRVTGSADAGLAALFAKDLHLAGESRFELALAGQTDKPQLSGFLEMERGQANLPAAQLAAEELHLRLGLTPDRVSIERFTGRLNGGALEATGFVTYSGTEWKEVRADLSLSDAFLNLPEGLRTRVGAALELRSRERALEVGGEVKILEGSFREFLTLEGGLLGVLQTRSRVELTEERSPFLANLRYNIALNTVTPLLIDNNLAKAALDADVRLVGTYYRPSIVGRVTVEEGGQLYLNEKRYFVERGVVSLVNEARIEPFVDVLARTEASGYDIELALSGGGEDFAATFTSEPPLSQPDIVSVLLTGRTLEEARGAEVNVAKEQALSYVSGGVGGRLSRAAEERTGLSQVRIEPNLISPESSPGARLTVGQDITTFARLIYSMNLADSRDQIYISEWDVTKRFDARAVRQQDNSYRLEFRHDLRLGGAPSAARGPAAARPQQRIGEVAFLGRPGFPETTLSKKVGLKPGTKYDFFRTQKGLDRLARFYESQDLLEAKVRVERETTANVVSLKMHVDAGPEVDFVYEGMDPSGGLRKDVRRIWRDGLFDAQRVQESVRAIRSELVKDRFLQATVAHEITEQGDGKKRVLFRISPGTRYRDVALVFPGAAGISGAELRGAVEQEGLKTEVYLEPRKISDFLNRYYAEQGYLAAKVGLPVPELDPDAETGEVTVPVQEGPLFKVGELKLTGNEHIGSTRLLEAIPLAGGKTYRPDILQASLAKIEEAYWSEGYNDVVIAYSTSRRTEAGLVDVTFQIAENRQSVVQEVNIEGNQETSEKFVRGQVEISPGAVLDFTRTTKARRNLYDTGAYSLVDIQTQPVPGGERIAEVGRKPVTLSVKLREVRPFEIRYGGFYDTDRGPGFIADFANRNSLGAARVVGLRTRYDSDLRELRGYFSQPLLRRLPLKTNLIGYTRKELFDTFITDRIGFSVQQETRFRKSMILSYGYRFEQADTYDRDPESLFKVPPLNLAPLTLAFTRETRDEFLDATRGSFLSHALEWAPATLGSDLRFAKYFGQYFKYLPLSRPVEIPWSGGLKRPRWVYAGGVRVGLGGGLGGQELIRSERFFAGGGTTIRGFKQNAIGPVDFLGDPRGGDAVFITNHELRFPVLGIFDGVGFADFGNVYGKVGDFDPFSVRKAAGLGLRVRTPYFLLRFDYGFKLDRRLGESRGGFFFSIGQAF